MQKIDFGIAWEWEYDGDFIRLLEAECERQGLSVWVVHPKNFDAVHEKIERKEISLSAYLDRAGDVLERFARFAEGLRAQGAWVLNPFSHVERSRDKATMHLEFLTKGLQVPFTVILSPYDKDPELRFSELEKLGRPFIIKPACGGGGLGVVMGAENLLDVIEARKEYRADKYLLQKKIIPKCFGLRRAWFRSFYVCGKVISCWWNDETHLYDVLTDEEKELYHLVKLKNVTRSIAEVCELNFFSTEIAIDEEEKFVVVDYVNEPCDMRMKSVHRDGVPDEVVQEIVQALVEGVKKTVIS
ncbi:MAG: hypothetical protein HYS08_08995 [Chlamydiae bacterium]|nr:hypothetical protein [Chlamydiota bacterium]MBI3265498.1 hypothetical protein [Chlamydiota bacterium]